jgi:hypothetical protein
MCVIHVLLLLVLMCFYVINIDKGFSQFDQNVDNFSQFESHRPLSKDIEKSLYIHRVHV